MNTDTLARSPALWNRSHLDLHSDETLAQLLDRGTLDDWRHLAALSARDPELRRRIRSLVARVPMYLPHFWLAVLASQGEEVDWDAVARDDGMGV